MNILQVIKSGLEILEPYFEGKQVCITEAGGDLEVWIHEDDPTYSRILTSVEDTKRLKALGWYIDLDGNWSVGMTK